MPNSYFRFKNFTVHHDRCAMKVTTDGCLFGAWCAREIRNQRRHITIDDLRNPGILDIGSGTGLLSLMIAQQVALPIDAVEIDTEAACQAKENVAASPYASSVNIINANILELDIEKQYQFIVSNPPFYEREIPSSTDRKNVAHHGKQLKIDELLKVVDKYLAAEGTFFMLLPWKRLKEVEALCLKRYVFAKKVLVSQTPLHPPFRALLQCCRHASSTSVDEMYIQENNGAYSEAFASLLKDYYLYL